MIKRKINDRTTDSIEKLIKQMSLNSERFKHLQVFLHRKDNINFESNREFLMVTKDCFGKVEVIDLDVVNSIVVIDYIDCVTKGIGKVKIDINESKSSIFFINWEDLRNMFASDY